MNCEIKLRKNHITPQNTKIKWTYTLIFFLLHKPCQLCTKKTKHKKPTTGLSQTHLHDILEETGLIKVDPGWGLNSNWSKDTIYRAFYWHCMGPIWPHFYERWLWFFCLFITKQWQRLLVSFLTFWNWFSHTHTPPKNMTQFKVTARLFWVSSTDGTLCQCRERQPKQPAAHPSYVPWSKALGANL